VQQTLELGDLRVRVNSDLRRGPDVKEDHACVDADLEVARLASGGQLRSHDRHPRRVLSAERLSQPAHGRIV
jgi:hypothetical protein